MERNKNPRLDKLSLPDEIWEELEEFDGYYISNLGRVYSKHWRKIIEGHQSHRHYGRIVVRLMSDGKQKARYVHRLVAEYFVRNQHLCKYVRHIDGDPLNNKASNLQWTDENSRSNREGVES